MVTPVVTPALPSCVLREAYCSRAEFLAKVTGCDTTSLVPGGNTAANTAALDGILREASGEVDAICNQVLAATQQVQAGRYRYRSDGRVWVPLDQTPVVSVDAVSLGASPGELTALTDLSGVWLGRKSVHVPTSALSASTGLSDGGWLYAQVTYTAGWANTTLAATTLVSATSLTVTDAVGIVPGLSLRIYDGVSTEQVVVASSYAAGATTVPLAAAMASAHTTAGVAISAMPEAVRKATRLLAAASIKRRGSEAVVLGAVSDEPVRKVGGEPGMSADRAAAEELLRTFKRTA